MPLSRSNRFASFSDPELVEIWKGLTMDDGISYGIEPEWSPALHGLAVELLAEAQRRGIAEGAMWEGVV